MILVNLKVIEITKVIKKTYTADLELDLLFLPSVLARGLKDRTMTFFKDDESS